MPSVAMGPVVAMLAATPVPKRFLAERGVQPDGARQTKADASVRTRAELIGRARRPRPATEVVSAAGRGDAWYYWPCAGVIAMPCAEAVCMAALILSRAASSSVRFCRSSAATSVAPRASALITNVSYTAIS